MPYSGRRAVSYTDVRVPRAPLLACLTCPLCSSLVRDATTISECLHTFCRACIHAELSNGETECCPMCGVSLGTLPLDKLRPDHQLNDLKAKLFPSTKQQQRKRKLGAAGVGSPGSSTSTRRKERSLNSLGAKEPAAPAAAVNPGLATRKTRALAGALNPSSSSDGELEEEEEEEEEEEDQLKPSQQQQQGKGMTRRGASGARGGDAAQDAKNSVDVDAGGSGRHHHHHAGEGAGGGVSAGKGSGSGGGSEPQQTISGKGGWMMSKPGRQFSHHTGTHHGGNHHHVRKALGSSAAAASAAAADGARMVRPRRRHAPSLSNHAAAAANADGLSALDALAQAANAEEAEAKASSGGIAVAGGVSQAPDSLPSSRVMPGGGGTSTLLESGGSRNMQQQKENKDGAQVSTGLRNGTPNGQPPPPPPSLHHQNAQLRQSAVGGAAAAAAERQQQQQQPSNVRGGAPRPVPGSSGGTNRIFPNGIWFHLQTADNQADEDALPPLASPYVRIKDGKLPVSHVKKYLVQKLGQKVKCEKDVEITCRDQPVVSSLPLESIRDIWFSSQSASDPSPPPGEANSAPDIAAANAGHPSPKDFLMVLTYRRHRKPRLC